MIRSIDLTKNKIKVNGYIERYHDNGQLNYKGVYVNGRAYGYFMNYSSDGKINVYWSSYFLDGYKISEDNDIGYCYIWDRVEL